MGSWGITMRQSDCGLDLLGIIVEEHLKKVDFATFMNGLTVRIRGK